MLKTSVSCFEDQHLRGEVGGGDLIQLTNASAGGALSGKERRP